MSNKHGASYEQKEIDELLVEYLKPGSKARANIERLAVKYGRKASAIDFVFSWCRKLCGLAPQTFPPRARNRIMRQVADAARRLVRKA